MAKMQVLPTQCCSIMVDGIHHLCNTATATNFAESISHKPSSVSDLPKAHDDGTPSPAAVSIAQEMATPQQELRKRTTASPLETLSPASGLEPPEGTGVDAASPAPASPQEIPAEITSVTIAPALQAAAFQMLPLRFVCAVGVAAAATSFDWSVPGVALAIQVMVANIALIFSAAWMLKSDPERCRTVLQQVHVRQGKMLDRAFSFVSQLTRAPLWFMRSGFTIAWAMYVDSGTYVAAVIVFYLLHGKEAASEALAGTGNID